MESHNCEKFPYLTIEGEDAHGTAFVKFKLDDITLESYILNNICDGFEIRSNGDWDNYELEIYNNNSLIYKTKHNIYRSIMLNIGITTRIIEKKYQSINNNILITNTEIHNPIVISDNTYLDFLERYLVNEKIEMNKIKNPKDSHCNFLKKDERERAFKILKNSLKLEKDEFSRFMESEGENFIYSINTKKIIICIENVIRTSQENTIRNMGNLKHISPSNGNYIHKISLIKRNKQLFICIDLFNIFKSKICVSNNCDKYEFNNGTIAEMICGRKNDETIKRINSNYEEIISNLNFSI